MLRTLLLPQQQLQQRLRESELDREKLASQWEPWVPKFLLLAPNNQTVSSHSRLR
jgi:hypothetical protein